MTSFWNHDPFLDRLQQHPGSPWTLFEAQQQLDALVLQPRPLSLDSPWADPTQFLDFLTDIAHRRLLHCFLSPQRGQQWTFEALLKQTRPSSPQALSDALEQCCFWHIALENPSTSTWQGHPRLVSLNNLGWTFEWLVQMLLEREYGALVRRHVILGEIRELGEIDLLAFLDDKWNRNTIPRHMGRVSWPPESRRHKTSIRGKDIIETCCCSMRVAATERDSSSNVADMKRKKGECIHAQRVTETPAAIPAPADASSLLLRQIS